MQRVTPSAQVSRRMSRTVGRDNPRERAIRSSLHALGLRYRIHLAAIIGTRRTVDIAFTRLRLAVFCDGCFWHGCPIHATTPKSNRDWWIAKIGANVQRDRDTDARLAADEWSVIRIWEHMPVDDAVSMITARLAELGSTRTPTTNVQDRRRVESDQNCIPRTRTARPPR